MNALTFPIGIPASVTELPPTLRIALRIAGADRALATPALGLGLPGRIGTRAVADPRSALCLGPDEWLVEAPAGDAALTAALATLAGEVPLSAVDVSDREITLSLEGPGTLDLLATGCPSDLARMPAGSGTRTIFDTVQVILTREAEDHFHLTVWRSFAPHVRALLARALAERATGL